MGRLTLRRRAHFRHRFLSTGSKAASFALYARIFIEALNSNAR